MEHAKNRGPEEKPANPEPKYELKKLRENCVKLFGVTTSTFDGAMHSCNEKELTVNEAKKRIDTWLKRHVKRKGE